MLMLMMILVFVLNIFAFDVVILQKSWNIPTNIVLQANL